ncbi:hypothetical protein [Clostridium tertium]|uniref:hypothetical protein n=1 Tax=Clostridium tertium TaxID=1559 RepID=UPI0018AB4237|nr:hypothetical protein [Clostridium tertium]
MEFITVEQFKEQPVEVQKVFLDWWKCEPFNIYAWCWNLKDNKWSIESCCNQIQADTINKGKTIGDIIPLFTEGQLRKFIEDKTNGKVESYYAWDYYTIAIRNTGCGGDDPQCDTEETNLLQAYWKLACMVAKEGLNG